MELTKYRVVHWYMDKLALEFLNIGVVAFDSKKFIFKLIDDELLLKIKANFIDKTIMSYTINHIRGILEKCENENDLDRALAASYQDNFRFSPPQLFNAFDSLENETNELFYRYISYKFGAKRDKPQSVNKEHIKEAVRELADKEFKNSIKVKKRYGFDFSLIIKDKEYPSILGSIENKEDISRAFSRQLEIPNFSGIYGITTPEPKITTRTAMFKDALLKVGYDPIQFANENQIYDSLEKLLGVA